MKKIFLISCVKSKRNYPTQAQDLYTSSLFVKMLDYAKKQNPDAILILSAKYGVLELTDVIEPYEKTLLTMKKSEKTQWANDVLKSLKTKTDIDNTHFVFLAGANYRENLAKHLKYFSVPMEGLQIGRQLQWLVDNV